MFPPTSPGPHLDICPGVGLEDYSQSWGVDYEKKKKFQKSPWRVTVEKKPFLCWMIYSRVGEGLMAEEGR